MKLRTAQRRMLRLMDEHRLLGFLARRQFGKTTGFAFAALKKMMKRKNHTVVFGSAKLNLSREIVRKEAAILQAAIHDAKSIIADAVTGRIPDKLTDDDFAGLYEAQRLEFRYYHSKSVYSRTKVVALDPSTVGETGDLLADEVGRKANWKDTWETIEPIVSSDPNFHLLLCTTPPLDDAHYSYEQFCPPAGAKFSPSAEGNIYQSDFGMTILRVDAFDAFADGVSLYDLNTGEPLTPAESRRRSQNKDAWDRDYGLRFLIGGSAACDLLRLDTARERGVGQCLAKIIDDDADFSDFLAWLRGHLHPTVKLGLGFDVATTTRETSNPSVLSVMEGHPSEYVYRAACAWKTRNPDIARERLAAIIDLCKHRPGGRPRALAIDATNEKYFAEDVRKMLRGVLPVYLVVASESVQKPGMEKPINWKQHLGDIYIAALDDNHLTLPPEQWFRADHRLVKKDRGMYVCEPDDDGHHGDTFDAGKLALYALKPATGITDVSAIRTGPIVEKFQFQARRMEIAP